MTEIPDSIEEITVEWLKSELTNTGTELLLNKIKEAGPLTAIEIDKSGMETQHLGEVRFIVLHFSDGTESKAVVKIQRGDKRVQAMGATMQLFSREHDFYKNIQAQLKDLKTPNCYLNLISASKDKAILVLEDLRPAIVVRISENEGISADQARLAVLKLARLHNTFFHNFPQNTELLSPESPIYQKTFAENFPGLLQHFLKLRNYSEELKDFEGFLMKVSENIKSYFIDFVSGPPSVIHGDYKSENIFFPNHQGEGEFALVDWQTYIKTGPLGCCAELIQFIYQTLPIPLRREIEKELITIYYETSDVVKTTFTTLELFVETVNKAVFWPLVMLTFAGVSAYAQAIQGEESPAKKRFEIQEQRYITALRDNKLI